jgi:rhamnosyl/mannosyltransferase
MRILQIGKYYPPARGGMETVLGDLCGGLRRDGHDVAVLVHAVDPATTREPLEPTAPGLGRLVRSGVRGTLASQPLSPGYLTELRRLVRETAPELVMLHWPNPWAAAALLAVRGDLPAGCRTTVWYHADITRQRLGGLLLQPLLRATLARTDGIAVSTASLRDGSRPLRNCRERVRVIPFGIDVESWDLPTRPGEGALLFVGRLVYYKGLELLLEAVARLPGLELEIVGDGPLLKTLSRRAGRADLAGRVRLHGALDDAALRGLMTRCGALVLPSLRNSETFGLVQLEAMAAGLPVVSTRLPTGVAEVNVEGETGLLAAPGDVDDLMAALTRLRDEPGLARSLGAAGRCRVREFYHRDRMVAEVADWYRALLTEGR